MDDKFTSNDINSFNDKPSANRNNVTSSKSGALGDFSENINSVSKNADTTGGSPFTMASKPKNFVVHLPDSVDYIPDFSQLQKENKSVEAMVPEYKSPSSTRMFDPVSVNESKASGQVRSSAAPVSRRPEAAPVKRTAASRPAMQSGSVKGSPSGTASRPAQSKAAKPEVKKVQSKPQKKQYERQPQNVGKSILISCLCLVFIAILTFSASTIALGSINDILSINGRSNETVTVTIPEGSRYAEVFNILKSEGLVKQPFVTDLFCKFRNYHEVTVYDRETQAYKTVQIEYTPGVYYLEKNMGIENMLETIMVSSSGNKDSVKLTFPEGWSIAKIFAKLEKYNVCEAEKLYANLDSVAGQYSFLKGLTNDNGRYLLAEGYLFPDTYDFYIGENASSVIKKLFSNFDKKWTSEYDARLKELGMTMDEIVTIASIIQREAKDESQMDVISSVIHNRIKNGATYPTLDMNSTKDYIISIQNDYSIFSEFYYNLYLNSYNTYSNKGLPPGPICNPGAAAIKAALYPADTEYNFFCHSKSGEMYLAKTVSEHQANAALVLAGN